MPAATLVQCPRRRHDYPNAHDSLQPTYSLYSASATFFLVREPTLAAATGLGALGRGETHRYACARARLSGCTPSTARIATSPPVTTHHHPLVAPYVAEPPILTGSGLGSPSLDGSINPLAPVSQGGVSSFLFLWPSSSAP